MGGVSKSTSAFSTHLSTETKCLLSSLVQQEGDFFQEKAASTALLHGFKSVDGFSSSYWGNNFQCGFNFFKAFLDQPCNTGVELPQYTMCQCSKNNNKYHIIFKSIKYHLIGRLFYFIFCEFRRGKWHLRGLSLKAQAGN